MLAWRSNGSGKPRYCATRQNPESSPSLIKLAKALRHLATQPVEVSLGQEATQSEFRLFAACVRDHRCHLLRTGLGETGKTEVLCSATTKPTGEPPTGLLCQKLSSSSVVSLHGAEGESSFLLSDGSDYSLFLQGEGR